MVNKKYILKCCLIFGAIVLLAPTIVGLILFLCLKNYIYWEVINVILGVLGLFAVIVRIRIRESVNLKATDSVMEDKKTPEYKEFIITQWLFTAIALTSMLVALIVYLCNFAR